MTLLTPLKRITTFKLSKLPIFRATEQLQLPQAVAKMSTDVTAADQTIIQQDPDPLPLLSPRDVLSQIGSKLREWREHYHLSIDDISARTQIQPRLVQAIEHGQIEVLPEWIYVKAMVKRYADNLGLNGNDITQCMIEWETVTAKPKTVFKQESGFNLVPQVKPVQIYLGYIVAICCLGAGLSHLLSNATRPQIDPIENQLPPQSSIIVAPVAAPLPAVPIEITVKAPAWAQIGVDGMTKFTGNLNVGTRLTWTATKQITISTNNAGGLLFARDGQQPVPVGKIGQKQGVTIKVGN